MGNLNKKLKDLFNAYLERLEKERTTTTYHSPCYPRHQFDNSDFQGVIYFYEWSDSSRAPRAYYTLNAFENFLNSSQIFLASFQKELIKNMHYSYIACKKGGKELIIKSGYEALKNALEEGNKDSNSILITKTFNKGSEDSEPYNVAITRSPQYQGEKAVKVLSCKVYPPNLPKSLISRPPMYMEPENRWSETEPELGGSWGW